MFEDINPDQIRRRTSLPTPENLARNIQRQVTSPSANLGLLASPVLGMAGMTAGAISGDNPVAGLVEQAEDALVGEAPKQGVVDIDPGTKQFAQEMVQRGQMTPEQLQAEKMSGVGEAGRGIIGGGPVLPTQDPMDAAIQRRAQVALGRGLQGLQSQSGLDAAMQKGNVLNKAFTAKYAMQNVATANMQRLMTAEANAEAARAAVLSAVLGGVGAGVGSFVGGRSFQKQQQTEAPQIMAGGFGDTRGGYGAASMGDPAADYNRGRYAYNDVTHPA